MVKGLQNKGLQKQT